MNFLDAPKIKRTYCYAMHPYMYEISCPLCDGSNITWSEFESHLWCYDCEKDVLIDLMHSGIFSGPIPKEIVTKVFRLSLDRINVETQEIVKFESPDDIFNSTWVYNEDLRKYEKEFEEKLQEERLNKVLNEEEEIDKNGE